MLTAEERERLEQEMAGYAVRSCRGRHWHVTAGDYDIMIPGDPFQTEEDAMRAAAAHAKEMGLR